MLVAYHQVCDSHSSLAFGIWHQQAKGYLVADEPLNIGKVFKASCDCAGSDSFQFDEAFGHKSCLKAVKETLKVWLTGLFLLLVANVTFLTRWLKAKSLKPGEGKYAQSTSVVSLGCDLCK